jgi:SAM-dependent methyltransferase
VVRKIKKNKKKNVFKSKAGIRLDIGAGNDPQPGFVSMDIRPLKGIDIVHDAQKFPYPIPDNSCVQILLSHLWEHIEPKYRIDLMDELWRIMQPEGQLLLSSPYAGSLGANQDPTHYTCPNEATFMYFDPKYDLYKVYKPKPWKLRSNQYSMLSNIEIIMEAVKV